MPTIIDNLTSMLGTERENQLLHFSLGNEYLKIADYHLAEKHLRKAVSLDPGYSAGWKLLGKTLNAAGKFAEAVDIFSRGIDIAEEKGDIQAAKEMTVFLKRARKNIE